ncbi:hypothetical protein HPB47_022825 [Ixodes persulcatus]|uniref:Uncharacterized protein n=1 Tax=Ixodes persulcatus TaxID=34615 RepID=A0AC60Q8M1_IXOPE|nr:hypothetical protein HPB47_022825 [Ixodes persulcatus]
MDYEVISKKRRSGEFMLKAKTGKSDIWKRLREIADKDKVIKDFIACSTCKKAYQYSSHKRDTSSLLKHKCQTANTTLSSVTSAMKERVVKGAVEFIARDARPFEAIAGQGVRTLEHCFLDIGAECEPPSKKRRHSRDGGTLSDLKDTDDEVADTASDEVDKYIAFKWVQETEFDLLKWWSLRQRECLYLTLVAQLERAIPATSAPAERDISLASLVIQERRTSPSPSIVDDILFLHSNLNK